MSADQIRQTITLLEQATASSAGKVARMVTKTDGVDKALEYLSNQQATIQNTFANMSEGTKFELYFASASNPTDSVKGTFIRMDAKNIHYKTASGKAAKIKHDAHMIHTNADDAPNFTQEHMADLYGSLESAASIMDDVPYDMDMKKQFKALATKLGVHWRVAVVVNQIMEDYSMSEQDALALIQQY